MIAAMLNGKEIDIRILTVGVWVRPEFVAVEAHVLLAVGHAVFGLPSEGYLVVARKQEGLAEVLLEVHPIIDAELRTQPLE